MATVKCTAAGDSMVLRRLPGEYEGFTQLRDFVLQGDFRFVNLETTIHNHETYGAAVSGIVMVLGLLYGYDASTDEAGKKAHYQRIQQLAGQFREEVGSIVCREILKNPPSDPNPTPRTAEFYKQRPCTRMVMIAARILEAYIRENPPQSKENL